MRKLIQLNVLLQAYQLPCLILLVTSLSACGVSKPRVEYEVVRPEFEVSSSEEERRTRILASPTKFIVPFGEDRPAWARAKLFLESYATNGRSPLVTARGDRTIISSDVAKTEDGKLGHFKYEISKVSSRDGMSYTVKCIATDPRIDPAMAERNARNAAHFIQQGELELSLLTR